MNQYMLTSSVEEAIEASSPEMHDTLSRMKRLAESLDRQRHDVISAFREDIVSRAKGRELLARMLDQLRAHHTVAGALEEALRATGLDVDPILMNQIRTELDAGAGPR